jgi:CMP-N,N'-diacetyllegionaminic acid synthase
MVRGEPLIAIVPARAGSKGIAGKNLWRYEGLSLLERAVLLARSSDRIDRVIVSTDSAEMLDLAKAAGAEAKGLRPAHLASDTATSAEVVAHVLAEEGLSQGHLLLLQTTSPLRTKDDMGSLIATYATCGAPALVSVTKHDEPRPEKLKRIENGKLKPYLDQHFEGPRQALPTVYRLNGAFYAISIPVFLREKRFLPEGTMAYEMPASRSHNLDSPEDLQILEAMLAAKHWQLEAL